MTILNRLRSAESGSRELDAAIESVAKDWHYPDGVTATAHHYSTSIDAALALVERMLPGWLVKLNKRVVPGWSVRLMSPSFDFFSTNDFDGEDVPQSAPLAILTALFTALEAKDTAP